MPEWNPPASDDDIVTLETVTTDYLNGLGNSLRWMERIAYTAFTSTVNVTSTNSASPDSIVSLASHDYEAVPHWWEFGCPQVNGISGVQCHLQLWDDSSVVCRVQTEARVTSALNYGVGFGFEYTPPAGVSVFSIRGYIASAGTWAFVAGNGFASPGATTNMPGFFRVSRVPV